MRTDKFVASNMIKIQGVRYIIHYVPDQMGRKGKGHVEDSQYLNQTLKQFHSSINCNVCYLSQHTAETKEPFNRVSNGHA